MPHVHTYMPESRTAKSYPLFFFYFTTLQSLRKIEEEEESWNCKIFKIVKCKISKSILFDGNRYLMLCNTLLLNFI